MAAPSGGTAFPNYNVGLSHVEDPNERRQQALARIDNAPFGWRHARAVVVAGVGFFTDSYDIFAINLCSSMLGVVFWQDAATRPGKMPYSSDTAIKVSTSAGTVIGQLFFGWIELIIIILATLAQCLSSSSPAMSITGLLVFWRTVMGVGIGGDYPLSSIITSDGVCQLAVDKMWRVVIGFGAVPACVALYYRLTIPETPRYTFDVARDLLKADEDVEAYIEGKREGHPDEVKRVAVLQSVDVRLVTPKASWSDFWSHYLTWRHGKVLLGSAGSWFFLHVAFYGLGLNNSIILTAIGWNGGSTVYEYFYRNAVGNLILICAGAIPGYLMTVATVDWLGRKPIQITGFVILTILFIIIGFAYEPLKKSDNQSKTCPPSPQQQPPTPPTTSPPCTSSPPASPNNAKQPINPSSTTHSSFSVESPPSPSPTMLPACSNRPPGLLCCSSPGLPALWCFCWVLRIAHMGRVEMEMEGVVKGIL
ncbi:MFS general substrate transporter [Aspergillus ibericus CBS 121593]|uniref:MFS general substrate transporter n=1 Tax=Aspergillus ibericus CBS 121593 TaxID=1448316 RepID=A0A395GN75_9EURO|nr:MFS general substrate transporter [Aspergillus ibericus CBS 121593]RAK96960.1 MFS general substrate transporter [Aspergillus ibericus CBS 121593]